MADKVADSSAVLAVLLGEPAIVGLREAIQANSVMCTVNYSEAVSKYEDLTGSFRDGVLLVRRMVGFQNLVPFDIDLAERAAELRASTRAFGLSLGDRACLALAQRLRLPVVTAERTWAKLNLGIEVQLVR